MKSAIASSALFLALASVASADLKYTVSDGSDPKSLKISIELKATQSETAFQIPNWAPGSYRYDDNWKKVSKANLTVNGKQVEIKTDSTTSLPVITTWKSKTPVGATVVLTYEVPVQLSDGIGHYAGPSTYIYPVGRLREKVKLSFGFKPGTMISTGLDATNGAGTEFKADDYDVLADNPVTYGKFELDKYFVGGKPHYIAYRGAAVKDVDRAYVIKACEYITKMQGDFFGGLPYNKYVWHFAVNGGADGAGGLEHLSSTQISMAAGVGPGVVSVYSHEFFHLWNVKRIRSMVLGPFDYTTLPQTGALWWLEGVTDYYAHTLLGRYGWYGKNEREKDAISKMYADLVQNVNAVRAREARKTVSPYESSFRVRDAANGRGNSQGYQVSYYDTGWLCGFVLDVEILEKSGGKNSLDDVEKSLWKLCKDSKPGFPEDQIRKECIKFGGESLGAFYDQVIMKPGELPVEAALNKIGLQLEKTTETFGKLPFVATSNMDRIGLNVASSDVDGLQMSDVILSIAGKSFDNTDFRGKSTLLRQITREAKPGDIWSVRFKRGDKEDIALVEIGKGTRPSTKVTEMAGATSAQKKLRAIFEAAHRK
jgi:predicted metalloprotease with PDZ domain